VLPALYDDGGFSGGTMERPALKRLIADIEAGQIDLVVVYKVDRLTRALSDWKDGPRPAARSRRSGRRPGAKT
jgi:site-specific DNA recombinase